MGGGEEKMNENKNENEAPIELVELRTEVKAGFAGIEQQMITIFNTLEKIDHTLNGNGQPGLVEKVVRLEERLQGTWKTLIILGWLANFAVAVVAIIITIIHH